MIRPGTEVGAWILGSGGLLGGALVRQAQRVGVRVFNGPTIPWHDRATRGSVVEAAARAFASSIDDGRMVVIWAAGTAGVGSHESEAEKENEILREVMEVLTSCWPATGGAFFLTSSAGAVYAGAGDAPFNAESPTRGNSPYGRSKLWQEDFVRSALPSSVDVHIGRLGNIYGPTSTGRQGLIPRLCAAALTRRAMNLFVPLDTLRDYCFVDDAASLIWRQILQQGSARTITVISSGRSVSVSEVVSTVQQVAHRKVPIALGSDPEADRQPSDLRLRPDWLTSYPDFQPIDLGTGIKRIIDNLAIASRR